MKQTKNIITRDMCRDEQKNYLKASICMGVALTVFILLPVPLFFYIAVIFSKDSFIASLIPIIPCCICIFPFFLMIKTLSNYVNQLRFINQGRLSIAKDTVYRLAINERAGRTTQNAIYFSKYGRYVPAKSIFDLSSVGDEFYLVIIPAKKPKICFAYHTMMYECNDVDDVNI